MASGLFALLDDIATIAKVAAASLDDIGASASKASVKAAGVVIDDAAVTPRYVTGLQPARELPIIWRIAKGSLFNKMVIILPALLLLSSFAEWAITPILMLGGAYLSYEGAEKIWHALFHKDERLEVKAEKLAGAETEEKMVSGAVRTDLILSTEIMVIALNEVINESLYMRAGSLIVVGLGITVVVYGAVGLIVKMDDIGLAMARGGSAARQSIGRALVKSMPKILSALAVIGTVAMLWVGGQIILHGTEVYGLGGFAHWLHDVAATVGSSLPVSGVWTWAIGAAGAGVVGLIVGGIIIAIMQMLPSREKAAH